MLERTLGPTDLQNAWGVSRATAYRLMDEIGATRLGGSKRVLVSRVEAYVRANTEKSLAEHLAEV